MARPSLATRAAFIIPLLLTSGLCFMAFRAAKAVGPALEEPVKLGVFEWTTGTFELWKTFYRIKPLDELWRIIVTAFIPSTFAIDPVSWWQMFSFITDVGVVYAVWIIEANRAANRGTTAYFPGLIAQIFQVIGGGIIGPLYYVGYVLSAPNVNSLTAESRVIDPVSMRTLLPSIVLTYQMPAVGAYFGSTLESRHFWTWVWQMFPIWIGLSQLVLTRLSSASSSKSPRTRSRTDLFDIQATLGILGGFSALTWLYTFVSAPYSMRQIFIPDAFTKDEPLPALRTMLQYDHMTFFGATLVWLLFMAWDLTTAGLKRYNFGLEAVALVASTLAIGPGAATALFWVRREDLLLEATKARSRRSD